MLGPKFYRRLIPLVMLPHASSVERAWYRITNHSVFNLIMTKAGGFEPRPCLMLRTIHWKTGKLRDMILPYGRDGERYVLTGSLAGRPKDPVWATNIRADGSAWVRINRKWVFCDAYVAQGEERERVWNEVNPDGQYGNYTKMAHPRILPVVVLQPRKDAKRERPSEDFASEPPA
jgi:deazaflavin-dependent oxidoreductase (nitroreductase family)